MAKRKRREPNKPFGVAQCSLCEEFDLTFGEQRLGGVRYCEGCLRDTLGWRQLADEQRASLTQTFALVRAQPEVQRQIAELRLLPAETKKANAIGESKRRLYEANMREARGY